MWNVECGMCSEECSEDVGDEHRGRLLHIIAPCMEQGVECELWSPLKIESLWTPWYWRNRGARNFPRIDTNARGRLFIEGSQEAVQAFFAHYQPRLTDKILG